MVRGWAARRWAARVEPAWFSRRRDRGRLTGARLCYGNGFRGRSGRCEGGTQAALRSGCRGWVLDERVDERAAGCKQQHGQRDQCEQFGRTQQGGPPGADGARNFVAKWRQLAAKYITRKGTPQVGMGSRAGVQEAHVDFVFLVAALGQEGDLGRELNAVRVGKRDGPPASPAPGSTRTSSCTPCGCHRLGIVR